MANPMRNRAIQGLKEGETFTLTRSFSQAETKQFGQITRDYNPVHYDHRWAESKGYKGLICHGLLIGSMICEFGGQVGWLATGMGFRYLKPVHFGETITCRITITKIEDSGRAEAEAEFTNQDGETVCISHISGRIPIRSEKTLLNAIVNEGDFHNPLSGNGNS